MLRKNVLETERRKKRERDCILRESSFLSLLAHHKPTHTNNPPKQYCPPTRHFTPQLLSNWQWLESLNDFAQFFVLIMS